MTSTTLSAKKKNQTLGVFQWQLRRSMGLSAVYASILLLAYPVVTLFALFMPRDEYYLSLTKEEQLSRTVRQLSAMTDGITLAVGASLMLLFALIFTVWNFGYLHRKQQIDLFHAMPISRGAMFWGKYLSGCLCLYAPVVLAFLLQWIVMLCFGVLTQSLFLSALKVLAILLLMTCAVFSFTVLIAVCSGSTLDTMASIALISISYPVLIFIGGSVIYNTIPGLSELFMPLELVCAFSPPAAAYLATASHSLDGVFSVGTGFWLWWVTMAVLLTLFALFLYCRRKSESAESTVSYGPVKLAIRVLSSGTGGMLFGYLVYLATQNHLYYLWGTAIASLLAYVVTELVYTKTLRRLHRHLIPYGGVLLIFALFTAFVSFGFFGLDTYLPKADEVECVDISYNHGTAYPTNVRAYSADKKLSTSEDWWDYSKALLPAFYSQEKVNQAIELNKTLIEAAREEQYPYTMGQNKISYDLASWTCYLNYYPGESGSFTRCYCLHDAQSNASFQKALSILRELYSDEEYLNGLFPINAIETIDAVHLMNPEDYTAERTKLLSALKDEGGFRRKLESALYNDLKAQIDRDIQDPFDSEKEWADTNTSFYEETFYSLNYASQVSFTPKGGVFGGKAAAGKELKLASDCAMEIRKDEFPETFALLEELFEK